MLDLSTLKEDDRLILNSENGLVYKIEIISINEFRPPDQKYAIDIVDPNGNSYYSSYGDVAFVGEDFILKCTKEVE